MGRPECAKVLGQELLACLLCSGASREASLAGAGGEGTGGQNGSKEDVFTSPSPALEVCPEHSRCPEKSVLNILMPKPGSGRENPEETV